MSRHLNRTLTAKRKVAFPKGLQLIQVSVDVILKGVRPYYFP